MSGLEMKYFVLNPNKKDAYGKASRKAIIAYANEIEAKNKDLSKDLISWMIKIKLGEK
jgi:hypothetical protein